jgi:2-dehydro-3-deoxygluconokinase
MPELLCMGEPMLELNAQPPGPDGRVLYLEGHGGDTSNAAICAARQGASVGYVTAIGEDRPGASFLRLWAAEGVDTTTVRRDPQAPTALYVVTHDAGGHAFTFYRSNSAASRYAAHDLPEDAIRAARILHVSGISQGISLSACDAVFAAMDHAQKHQTLISYDTNLRLRLWPLDRARAVIHAALHKADFALPGLDDAQQLTGLHRPEDICDLYLGFGCSVVALTMGKNGTMVATGKERQVIPARPVQALDATGAGDTFDGAFLAHWLVNGNDPFAAADYANAAAALSTLGYGAVGPIPRRNEVIGFMRGDG